MMLIDTDKLVATELDTGGLYTVRWQLGGHDEGSVVERVRNLVIYRENVESHMLEVGIIPGILGLSFDGPDGYTEVLFDNEPAALVISVRQ